MLKRLLSTNPSQLVNLDVAILILRVGAAILILTHGYPKLTNVLAGDMGFGDPLGLGPATSLILVTFAEFFCAVFILLGLGTRIASIPLIINTIVIAFVAHADDPFSVKEKGLLFLVMFLVLFITGSGKYSLDGRLFGKNPR
ncbi:MAG: DoxX family protein [Balneolaceae bacterium]